MCHNIYKENIIYYDINGERPQKNMGNINVHMFFSTLLIICFFVLFSVEHKVKICDFFHLLPQVHNFSLPISTFRSVKKNMPKICFRDYQLMNPLKNMFHPITIYIKVKNKGAELPLLKKIRTDNRVSPCFHIQPYTNHVLLKRHTISSMK